MFSRLSNEKKREIEEKKKKKEKGHQGSMISFLFNCI